MKLGRKKSVKFIVTIVVTVVVAAAVMVPSSFNRKVSAANDCVINVTKKNQKIKGFGGTHFYGTSIKDMSYPLFQEKGAGKELWMTEVYVPNSSSSADKWPEAIDVSYNMHNALKNGFQSYVWWYIRRSYGPIKEDGNISKRGYCMAQYSKYVRPGYTRIDATEQPQSNIYISAYKGDNNTVVIVAINKGTSALNQNFVVNNSGALTNVDRYRTSQNENLANSKNMAKSNHSLFEKIELFLLSLVI